MRAQQQENFRIATEAAEWLGRLEEHGTQEHAAFARWMAVSPQHVEAVLKVAAVDQVVKDIQPQLEVTPWVTAARQNVVALQVGEMRLSPAVARAWWRRPPARWSMAAAVLALMGTALFVSGLLGGPTYTTGIGELRTVRLSDGSTVELSTRSRVQVKFSDSARDLVLEGEALFKVQRDPTRPFRVYSGPAVIQAVGTQFNVHRRPSSTVVSVLEGAVLAESVERTAQLVAGEEARIDREGRIEKHSLPDSGVGGWEPRLIFSDDRLEDIVTEFNRWNVRQLRVADERLGARLYSGAFNADRPESLIAFLRQDASLTFDERRTRVTIRRAPRAGID